MHGQRLTIRIITDEYLPMQNLNKFKYEVMSKASESRGNVDVIYSAEDIHLSAGHMYYVHLNEDQKAPRVVRLFREVG